MLSKIKMTARTAITAAITRSLSETVLSLFAGGAGGAAGSIMW
jgi:hypothetical protein